jgi:hypothetical protein
MVKTVEEMAEEVKEKNSFFTRDDNGYCGMRIERVVPSDKGTAIAYQTGGSNWNRGGVHGGGISYFQGTGVYDGETDLVVKPHQQWRSGSNYADDCPNAQYSVVDFRDLGERKYELVLRNIDGEERLEVDFCEGEIRRKT